MGLGLHVGNRCREVGAASFLHAFFSTISAHLEPSGWGSRFPTLMEKLYRGRLPAGDVMAAKAELTSIRRELAEFPPAAIVWDIDDRSKRPPWGDHIDPEITSLANYFVTSDGKDLFDVLFATLDAAAQKGQDVLLE
jgi:2,3-bisphosphoglycerate-dependent phosphoglycerate mutase